MRWWLLNFNTANYAHGAEHHIMKVSQEEVQLEQEAEEIPQNKSCLGYDPRFYTPHLRYTFSCLLRREYKRPLKRMLRVALVNLTNNQIMQEITI